MKNPVFLHHDGITFADLLSFAILYSKGDVGDKVEAMMWQLDDSNEKKVLPMVNDGAYTGQGDSLLSKTQ